MSNKKPLSRFAQLATGLLLGLSLVAQGAYAQDRRDDDNRSRQEQRERDRDRDERGGDHDRRDDDHDHDRRDDDRIQANLTTPAPGTHYAAPATVVLTANAVTRERNRRIVRVEFYHGNQLIGADTRAPYTVTWRNVPAGNYRLAARAIDDRGDSDWSRFVPIRVTGSTANVPPTVNLTAPTAGQVVTAPGTLTVSANAADSDGTVAKVDFYQGSTLIGTATTAPYSVTWSNVPAGSYSLTAVATDDKGASTTSTPVAVIVNTPPSVSLAANAASFIAPASVTLNANATDGDGTIARVDFYQGATLIGTATAAPYTVVWSNVASGSYTLTAVARDNQGASTTSAPIGITVAANQPPVVSLSSPTAGQVVTAPGTLTVIANASDSDGAVAKVEFYQGTTLIGTATAAPYSVSWSNVPAGSYSLTAVATDDKGASTTSAAVLVTVNAPPSVSLTAPAANQVVNAPANITISANASDSNGTVAKVDFYQGATLIGTATAAPYTATWSNVPAGTYSLTAVATDNNGATTTSAPVAIIVNAPPTVALTSPMLNQVVSAPATITVSANATDGDGTIAKVDFYQGSTLIGTSTTAPYTVTWTNAPAGTYSLTAVATDDKGATMTSAAVPVTVNAPPSVSLTAPAANQVVNAPGPVTIAANAADSDGTIAKVDFYQGTTLIGTATTAPYTFTWSNVPSGAYALTAVATDDRGASTTSAAVQVIVNAPPGIALTSPTQNQVFNAPGTLTLTAAATDNDGTIAKVEFYQGATLIGTATAAPYLFMWDNVPAGSYTLTAKATDDRGATTTSSPVTVVVNAPPTVSITAPANNARIIGPATVTVSANVSDVDGATTKVDFYQGTTLIGTVTSAPYSVTWANVQPGSYTLTAVAMDDRGATTTSAAVALSVVANQAPTVWLTAPGAGQKFTAPANIGLTVNAADVDGSLVRVDYFQNGNLIGTATTAPFNYTWTNVPQGTYALTAQATDDLGMQTISAPVTVTVNAAGPALGMYFIHPDHLGTPRLITDGQQNTVWRWDNTEPFGNNPPNEDPNATGTPFAFNPRFPGQYFDRETNLHYNYFRDYDSSTGRYIQSDPVGLAGGINTYGYVNGNPLSNIDPFGLAIVDPNSRVGGGGGGGAEGLVIAGAALVNAIMNSSRQSVPPSSTPAEQSEPNRSIWPPERQPGLWSCKARADCNDNIPGNCPDDPKHRFAFGGGSAPDQGTARNIAKANATSNLQCQPKHVSCKCTGPKGEQYSGGC